MSAILFSTSIAWAVELSFADAVSYMNENSIALKIAQLNLELATLDYKRALATNLANESQHSKLQAEYNLARAQQAFKNSKESNYLEVLKKYTDIMSASRNLEVREYESKIAEHNFMIVQKKIALGEANKLDELRELNRLEGVRRAEEQAKSNLTEGIRALKTILALDEEVQISLTSSFALPEFTLSLEECLQLAFKNSFDIWEREMGLELQEIQLQKSKIDGLVPLELEKTELNMEIARLNFERAQEDLKEKITANHHSLTQTKIRYLSTERELEISQASYQISQQQAKLGLITDMQMLEAQLSLLKAENALDDALTAYMIAKIQFEQLLGLEVEPL